MVDVDLTVVVVLDVGITFYLNTLKHKVIGNIISFASNNNILVMLFVFEGLRIFFRFCWCYQDYFFIASIDRSIVLSSFTALMKLEVLWIMSTGGYLLPPDY